MNAFTSYTEHYADYPSVRFADVSGTWTEVAELPVAGRWQWRLCAKDVVALRKARLHGEVVTVQRREADGRFTLLARRVRAVPGSTHSAEKAP